jgi:small GTP-binding protein
VIQKKICTVGASAVGKTSLLARFVNSIFQETYLTTIGVKIDKKMVNLAGQDVMLMLWDLAGEDEFAQVQTRYLRGASGYLLVVDRTRPDTLETAFTLKARIDKELGELPCILIFNKSDLVDEIKIDKSEVDRQAHSGFAVMETSAKTGQGVEEAFLSLTKKLLNKA